MAQTEKSRTRFKVGVHFQTSVSHLRHERA